MTPAPLWSWHGKACFEPLHKTPLYARGPGRSGEADVSACVAARRAKIRSRTQTECTVPASVRALGGQEALRGLRPREGCARLAPTQGTVC